MVWWAKMEEGSVERQDVFLIPGRENHWETEAGRRKSSYPPREQIQGAGMFITTTPRCSSVAKPIKVKWIRR